MGTHNSLHHLFKAPYLLTDPGDGGTITVDRQLSVIPIDTTSGAADITLAAPTKAGLFTTVYLETDGGDLTLTVTNGYNADGDEEITFDDAGDWVTFYSIKIGTTGYWRVMGQEGTGTSSEDLTVDTLSASAATITELALGVQTIDMDDAEVALTASTLTGNILFVDPNSSGASEDLLLPPEADCTGVPLIIVNTGGEHIAVKDDSDTTTIVIVEDTETALVVCNGTSWNGGRLTTDAS